MSVSTAMAAGCLQSQMDDSTASSEPTATASISDWIPDSSSLPAADQVTYLPYETPDDIDVTTRVVPLTNDLAPGIRFTISIAESGYEMELAPHNWTIYRRESDAWKTYVQGTQKLGSTAVTPGESISWELRFTRSDTAPENTSVRATVGGEESTRLVVSDIPAVRGKYVLVVEDSEYRFTRYWVAGAFQFE